MFRIIFFTILIIYVLYKLGILRFNFYAEVGNNGPRRNVNNQRPADGNVNVDSVPPKNKQKKDFKGGEYVDYEEVK